MGLLVAMDLYRGGVPLQHYEFSSDSQRLVRMGKLPSAQVRLEDPAASRVHAIIELSSTQAMLVDMGADAGTIVNGKRVSKVRLNHGDQIAVGETVLVVGLGVTGRDAAAPAPVPAPAVAPAAAAPQQAPRAGAPAVAVNAATARQTAPAASARAYPPTGPAAAIGQRVVAKLSALGPDSLAEAERFVDWLSWRQQSGAAMRVRPRILPR